MPQEKWGKKTGFEKAAPQSAAAEPEVKEAAPEPAPPPAVPAPEPECAPVVTGGTCPVCGWNLSDPVKGIEPHEIFAVSTAT